MESSRFGGIPITRLADSSRRRILGSILGGSLGLFGLKHVADAAALDSPAKCKKIKNKKRRKKCLAKSRTLPLEEPGASDQPLPPAEPVRPSPPPPAPPPPPNPPGREVHLPVRAAFYYPWFPQAWSQQGFNPYTNFQPSLGSYDSGDAEIIRQHIQAMQYGGIAVGIASWWGIDHHTDTRIPALLASAADAEFLWALYYEREGETNPSVEKIQADLTYIRDRYAGDPSYARVDGKFVVFVYNADDQDCAVSTRWREANTVGAYVVLKTLPNYRTCADQPQGWHQYAPARAADRQAGYSFTISPGFWKKGEDLPRLERDLGRWEGNIRDMVASGAPWQLVTTFNEWGEGSSVESAVEWQSSSGYGAYLDALHRDGLPDD